MRKNERGFTLIELVVVIVVLGILAAVALPKFVDMKSEAAKAQADGVYGAVQAAVALNHAAVLVGKAAADCPAYHATDCPAGLIVTTGDAGNCLENAMEGGLPSGWSASGDTVASTIGSTTYTITVSSDETASAKAVVGKSW